VRLEGEVVSPGEYYVAPNATLGEVLRLAGGLTPRAFVYGTRFERVSVREQQRESFREAIDQLEISLAGAPLTAQAGQEGQQKAAREVLERLKHREPDGRVVLNLPFEATALPSAMTLENNDRIYVPARPTTVGVFGAVYRSGSFEISGGSKIKSYLEAAGGPQASADTKAIFVVHANGAVDSMRNGALRGPALPGDLVFVPVRAQHASYLSQIGTISALVSNFGLALAAIHAVFP
jgi:protein involved in polysaccharide export with SLBB domain